MADLHSSPPLLSMSSVSLNSNSSSVSEEGVARVMISRHSNRRINGSINSLLLRVSFFILVLVLWAFGWMVMVFGVYAPEKVCIGPNSAILIEPNFFVVESLKVTEAKSKSGLELFGFYNSPLDVLVNWSESRLLSISHKSHKEWSYYLNQGTSLNISYSIKPQGSSVQLVVNEVLPVRDNTWLCQGSQFVGRRGIPQLLNEDANRNTAFSWNLSEGSGVIELKINKSSSYSFSVNNLNMNDVKVKLDIDVRAVLYDTKESFYKCTLSSGECTFYPQAILVKQNSVVLTSPAPSEGVSIEEEWCIMFSYEPRIITCIVGTLMLIIYMAMAMQLCSTLKCGDGERYQTEHDPEMSSERTHLLEDKDEDGSSVGSSNESLAADDADLEDFVGNEGEASNSNRRRLCVICFDSPRDCFFLHCGHCVSCFQCGTKVVETSGSCPICRRKIKKVKRIYTV